MQANAERLMDDLRAVVGDAEELLKATAGETGERVGKIRARAEESVRNARARLAAARQDVVEAARDVNGQVHEHPWASAGVAAGVGLIVGYLLARK